MKRRDVIDLLVLGPLWGGSFPFMRVAAPEFGPIPLIELRVTIAALVLIPAVFITSDWKPMKNKLIPIIIMGIFNSAVPFALLAYATLSVTSGFAAILNATTTLFGALVAMIWYKEYLTWPHLVGLVVGFCGVIVLVSGKASFKPGGSGLAIVAALIATFSYGATANYAKRNLSGVQPLVTSAGSLLAATIFLCPLAIWFWPATMPSASAWRATAGLGFGCTAIAYVLYFRLIANVGATRTVTLIFLIPVFTMLFGGGFLNETVTMQMLIACGTIVLGTGLSTGLIRLRNGNYVG